MKRVRYIGAVVALVGVSLTPVSARVPDRSTPVVPAGAFDIRAAAAAIDPTPSQQHAARTLRRATPGAVLQWNQRFGTPETILRYGSPLAANTTPQQWLRTHAGLFGWRASDVDALTVEKTLTLPDGGATVVLLHQTFGGLHGGSFGGSIVAGMDRRGNLLSIRANVTRRASLAAGRRIDAAAALTAAAPGAVTRLPLRIQNGWTFFDGPGAAESFARPAAFPVGDAPARPVWEVYYAQAADSVWRTAVDAISGQVLYRHQTVRREAPEGRVFRNYPDAPRGGDHQMVSFKGDSAASPAGWLSVAEQAPGLPTTLGNNANVSTHWFLTFAPDGPGQLRPVSADGTFDEAFTDSWNTSDCGRIQQVPGRRVDALPTFALDAMPAVVNLFYHFNVAHDYWYALGFTPEAGAMQANNFGREGMGGDPLTGLAQAGAAVPGLGRNNAYMMPTPDGVPPYSAYFVDEPADGESLPKCIDIDFDAQTIYHEYAHGVTGRYVGGEDGNLDTAQGGAMGESWSDFFAVHYLHQMGLEKRTSLFMYDVGGLDVSLRNWGMADVPVHYGDYGYDGGAEVHSDGEIWNGLLWDIRGSLAKARPGGAVLAAQLIADAMPLSGPLPSMLNMRDAILIADLARGGRNQSLLWSAFARHGFGKTAETIDATDVHPKAGFTHNDARQNGRVVLRVLDPVTGRPVHGLEVFMGQVETTAKPFAATNANGEVTALLAAGLHRMTVRGKGYGSRTMMVRVVAGRVARPVVRLAANYASASLGAKVVSSSGDVAAAAGVIDDTLASSATLPKQDDSSIVIRLAGATPVDVAEVRLAASLQSAADALKDWRVLTSMGGTKFSPLVSGRLGPVGRWGSALSAGDYESVRPKRVTKARYVKLVALSSRTATATAIRVAEIQVFGRGSKFEVKPGSRIVFADEGTVAVPAGITSVAATPTEAVMLAACTFPPPTQGTDAWVTQLPDAFAAGGAPIRVELTPMVDDPLADLDVYFLDQNCERIDAIATDSATETGVIPGGTKYVVSALFSTGPGTVSVTASMPGVRVRRLP